MTKKKAYLNFISDENLFKCIDHVYKVYSKKAEDLNHKNFVKNQLDPFKLMFDMKVQNLDLEGWIKVESSRQMDKALSNAMGTFHELLIAKSKNSFKLKLDKNRKTRVDLYNEDKSVFVEVKNKHNTIKGEDKKNVFKKLKKIADTHNATCYLLIINNKESIDKVWKVNTRKKGEMITLEDQKVRIISADQFYKLIFKDKNAFKKLIDILPTAINDYVALLSLGDKNENLKEKQEELANHFEKVAKKNKRKPNDEVINEGYENANYVGFD